MKNQENPESGEYWKSKGNAQFYKSNYTQAIEFYNQAIQINHNQPTYHYNKAKCFKNIHYLKQALEEVQQAIDIDDQYIKAHLLSGQILCLMGKEENQTIKCQMGLRKLQKGNPCLLALNLSQKHKKIDLKFEIIKYIMRAKKMIWYKNNKIKRKICQPIEDQFIKIFGSKQYQKLFRDQDIPQEFCCPISTQIMSNPVVLDSGHSYQKQCIIQHFKKNGYKDPFTMAKQSGRMIENKNLKKAIRNFMEYNGWAYESMEGENIDF